jgi:hypothetical protein
MSLVDGFGDRNEEWSEMSMMRGSKDQPNIMFGQAVGYAAKSTFNPEPNDNDTIGDAKKEFETREPRSPVDIMSPLSPSTNKRNSALNNDVSSYDSEDLEGDEENLSQSK